MEILLVVLASVLAAVLGYGLLRTRRRLAAIRTKYSGLIAVDAEVAKRQADLEKITAEVAEAVGRADAEKSELREKYTAALDRFTALQAEISHLEENLEDISFGLYKPHFDFQSSDEYKAALEAARKQQKAMVRAGHAATCSTEWTVGGSKREGAKMAKQNMKLFLKAFNAECDAAIANVAWNNAGKMVDRIKKSREALNGLGTVLQVSITEPYMNLKLDELRLKYEHERKRQEEREEQRRIREQIRDEERTQREIARAKEEAEKEENRYEKALAKARAEIAEASGETFAALQTQIVQLEAKLEEAHQQKERAISRAQLTRSGYVYIISNLGSFGEGVYKVGMTRRLEPMDRIAELGDASVPFPFDVHAMLYSDDAPELERALHQFLNERRVNLVNPRKEFFTATLKDIEEFAQKRGIAVEFTMVAEAREYHETAAIRSAVLPELQSAAAFLADPFQDDLPAVEVPGPSA